MYDQEASWDRLQGQHENQQTRRTTTALLKTAIIVFKMQLIFTVTEFRQSLKTLMRQDFLPLSEWSQACFCLLSFCYPFQTIPRKQRCQPLEI